MIVSNQQWSRCEAIQCTYVQLIHLRRDWECPKEKSGTYAVLSFFSKIDQEELEEENIHKKMISHIQCVCARWCVLVQPLCMDRSGLTRSHSLAELSREGSMITKSQSQGKLFKTGIQSMTTFIYVDLIDSCTRVSFILQVVTPLHYSVGEAKRPIKTHCTPTNSVLFVCI